MPYLVHELKKQNAFSVYWLCHIFLFFRIIIKANSRKTAVFLFYQAKSRFYRELMDSKVQTTKDIIKENKCFRVYNRDETLIKIGSWELVWLWWVAIEPKHRQILHIDISFERTMLIVAERFIASLINTYGKHPVSTTDGGTWYPPQACRFLKLRHHIHSQFEKSIIERTMQYIKDRIESFDDYYFPCK